MNTCSFIIHFNQISMRAKGIFRVMSSKRSFSLVFQSTPLIPKASPNTKKLKTTCIESFRHFDTLGS